MCAPDPSGGLSHLPAIEFTPTLRCRSDEVALSPFRRRGSRGKFLLLRDSLLGVGWYDLKCVGVLRRVKSRLQSLHKATRPTHSGIRRLRTLARAGRLCTTQSTTRRARRQSPCTKPRTPLTPQLPMELVEQPRTTPHTQSGSRGVRIRTTSNGSTTRWTVLMTRSQPRWPRLQKSVRCGH
jgi:hypothetical protein